MMNLDTMIIVTSVTMMTIAAIGFVAFMVNTVKMAVECNWGK